MKSFSFFLEDLISLQSSENVITDQPESIGPYLRYTVLRASFSLLPSFQEKSAFFLSDTCTELPVQPV